MDKRGGRRRHPYKQLNICPNVFRELFYLNSDLLNRNQRPMFEVQYLVATDKRGERKNAPGGFHPSDKFTTIALRKRAVIKKKSHEMFDFES